MFGSILAGVGLVSPGSCWAVAPGQPEGCPPPKASGQQGFKSFPLLLERLHDATGRRDHAGIRLLFYDQDAALPLVDCFRPLLTRLRAL